MDVGHISPEFVKVALGLVEIAPRLYPAYPKFPPLPMEVDWSVNFVVLSHCNSDSSTAHCVVTPKQHQTSTASRAGRLLCCTLTRADMKADCAEAEEETFKVLQAAICRTWLHPVRSWLYTLVK